MDFILSSFKRKFKRNYLKTKYFRLLVVRTDIGTNPEFDELILHFFLLRVDNLKKTTAHTSRGVLFDYKVLNKEYKDELCKYFRELCDIYLEGQGLNKKLQGKGEIRIYDDGCTHCFEIKMK